MPGTFQTDVIFASLGVSWNTDLRRAAQVR